MHVTSDKFDNKSGQAVLSPQLLNSGISQAHIETVLDLPDSSNNTLVGLPMSLCKFHDFKSGRIETDDSEHV